MYALKITKSNFALLKLLNKGTDVSESDLNKYLVINPEGSNTVVSAAELKKMKVSKVSVTLLKLNK